MREQAQSVGGIGFFGLLTILFIGLKLTGYIGWSWWWVLSPIWLAPVVIFIAVLLACVIVVLFDGGRVRVKRTER